MSGGIEALVALGNVGVGGIALFGYWVVWKNTEAIGDLKATVERLEAKL